MLMDENAQISAEMILIMGAILVLVIVAGGFIFNISHQIANSIGNVLILLEIVLLTECNHINITFFIFIFIIIVIKY